MAAEEVKDVEMVDVSGDSTAPTTTFEKELLTLDGKLIRVNIVISISCV